MTSLCFLADRLQESKKEKWIQLRSNVLSTCLSHARCSLPSRDVNLTCAVPLSGSSGSYDLVYTKSLGCRRWEFKWNAKAAVVVVVGRLLWGEKTFARLNFCQETRPLAFKTMQKRIGLLRSGILSTSTLGVTATSRALTLSASNSKHSVISDLLCCLVTWFLQAFLFLKPLTHISGPLDS